MRILFTGDVVGRPGRDAFFALLPRLRALKGPFDFVIVNGENSAAGHGLTEKIMNEFFSAGVDVLTSGNHIWDKREFLTVLDEEPRVLRPLNYPQGVPGHGWTVAVSRSGKKLAVVSLQGRVFMPLTDCPFKAMDALLPQLNDVPVFVDFHAEATSEKKAMGFYLDGRVTAVLGTHTHVQTADEAVLPNGTAYITDAGMTGAELSVLGVKSELAIEKIKYHAPVKFEESENPCFINGVVIDFDEHNGKANKIIRIIER